MSDSVTFTAAGAARLQDLLSAQGGAGPQAGLRIDVVAGGCSGHQYRLSLDEPADGDVLVEDRGAYVIVEPEAVPYVRGAAIHYADDEHGEGFRIENPNIVYGCGCGSSFVLREDAAGATA